MSAGDDRAPTGLEERLESLARASSLLVASDFDGTISPIVSDPALARPLPDSVAALSALALLDRTHVIVISGRALDVLADLTGLPPSVHLIGSHGTEFSPSLAMPAGRVDPDLLARVESELREFAADDPGFLVEAKPASIALHYRNVPGVDEQALIGRVLEGGVARHQGVHTKLGKKVIELTVVDTDKGVALRAVRDRLGAEAVVFLGDDVTDEDVFRTLAEPDLGVKVGPGETSARHRVGEPADVAALLVRLAALRATWLAQGSERR